MKPKSAKAKGRILQKWFRELIIQQLGLDEEDLESRPMGSQGEDIIMGKQSREKFPYWVLEEFYQKKEKKNGKNE